MNYLSFPLVFWLMVWVGYNATYLTDNTNTFNKWRSVLPMIAGLFSAFLITGFKLFSPLGFMFAYILCGIIGAFFCTRAKRISWWWAALFLSVVTILLAAMSQSPQYIYFIINMNWVIAGLLSLALMGYFLIQPGVLKGITFNSFFASTIRPFEGWLGVEVGKGMFGIVGTRPTGMARYSAITSLANLCIFIYHPTWYWFSLFAIFTFIMLFSKGKMEIISFLVSMGFVLFISNNLLSYLAIFYIIIAAISIVIIFGNIPYVVKNESVQGDFQKQAILKESKGKTVVSFSKKVFSSRIFTLSGRLTGVWPQALSFIRKRPWFGYGFGVEHYLLRGWLGLTASVDNTILNTLLQSGFIGTILFMTSLIYSSFLAYTFIHSGPVPLTLLEATSIGIFIILRGITQSFCGYSADWIFLAPLIAYIQLSMLK